MRFCEFWRELAGEELAPLVFDSELTHYEILNKPQARGIFWFTVHKRGTAGLARFRALPDSAWQRIRIERSGRYRRPHLRDERMRIKCIEGGAQEGPPQHRPRGADAADYHDVTGAARDQFTLRRTAADRERARASIARFTSTRSPSGLALNIDVDTP
jgi:hypothetical protein